MCERPRVREANTLFDAAYVVFLAKRNTLFDATVVPAERLGRIDK